MKTLHSRKGGSALITVMAVILAASAILGTMVVASMNRSHVAKRLSDRVRAVAIAEAGLDQAYSIMATNWAARSNAAAFPPTSYGGGTYDAEVQPVGDMLAIITSTGTCGQVTVDVMADIKNYGTGYGGWVIDSNAFKFAVLCGGNFDFGGCGTVCSTGETVKVHSNGKIDISGNANVGGDGALLDIESSVEVEIGNNITIYGDVFAPVLDWTDSKVDIFPIDDPTPVAVPLVTIPIIDLTPFYNWALAHGEVKPAGWTPPGDYTPNGGIVWVEGATGTISSHGTLHGSLIATGDIHISGDYNIDVPDDGYGFGLVSRDGDLRNQSSGTVEGLQYAPHGDYTQTANGTMIGQIIVGGTVSKGGNSDVILYKQYIPTLPDSDEGDTGDIVGVSAWQK